MSYARTMVPLQATAVVGLLLFGGMAFAQDVSSMDKKAGIKDTREKAQMLKTEVKEKKVELKEQKMEKKEKASTARMEKKEKIGEDKKMRTTGVINKLEAHVKNLEGLLARTESRVAKLVAQGGDTAKSAAFIATAKMKIAEAKVAIEEVKTKAQAITDAATRESITTVTLAARNAEAKVKLARAALSDAISSLKPGRNTVKPQ